MPSASPSPTSAAPEATLATLARIARAAGALAMGWFRAGARTSAHIDYKSGGSPVTEADLAVDSYLATHLRAAFPSAGWLSEETADSGDRLTREWSLIVDPIDGTRAFAEGDPRWAVSVALVRAGQPFAGVVEAPALNQSFTAFAGGGAYLNGARMDANAASSRTIAGPKPLIEPIARRLGLIAADKTPSLAVRFAHVASGAFCAGVASPNAHDWDIAAADLILREAGARLAGLDGAAIAYNRTAIRHGALYAAPAAAHDALLAAARV